MYWKMYRFFADVHASQHCSDFGYHQCTKRTKPVTLLMVVGTITDVKYEIVNWRRLWLASTIDSFCNISSYKHKKNQSHYRPEVPRGLQEVKVPRLRDNGPGWW